MSKRDRRVAFAEEVDIAEKRRREEQEEAGTRERSECALIGDNNFVNTLSTPHDHVMSIVSTLQLMAPLS